MSQEYINNIKLFLRSCLILINLLMWHISLYKPLRYFYHYTTTHFTSLVISIAGVSTVINDGQSTAWELHDNVDSIQIIHRSQVWIMAVSHTEHHSRVFTQDPTDHVYIMDTCVMEDATWMKIKDEVLKLRAHLGIQK